MILVDTSSWIHLLRPRGDAAARARVVAALRAGDACWCAQVRLELWNGASGAQEKKALRDFERLLPALAITDEVWALACELARKARAGGISVPATDLLIAACARHHGVELEHCDSDFDLLRKIQT
ncbi:MAG: PIN domain-containing protein [Xanthomonadaceae bacterium]|nr:PIN domain-containing protein [Xanthomonadaceae bacterium]MDE1884305.1 PIN domain-containing protein [Xanthomonadaceae bacterium]